MGTGLAVPVARTLEDVDEVDDEGIAAIVLKCGPICEADLKVVTVKVMRERTDGHQGQVVLSILNAPLPILP
jgi:hypothetical protein